MSPSRISWRFRKETKPPRLSGGLQFSASVPSRERVVLALLRWRGVAPWWSDLLGGVALGLIACAFRHSILGSDYRLPFVAFFPFVTLASLIGRPPMGVAAIVVSLVYMRTMLDDQNGPISALNLFAYVLSSATVIAIGDALIRALAAAEADRKRSHAVETFHISLFQSSNDAIVTKTLDGRITSWNPAAERMLGYPAHEAVGRPITMLFPADRQLEEDKILDRICRGEVVQHFVTERTTKSGARLHVSLTVSPIFDEAGVIVGASKIMRDVTGAKLSADALKASEERLRCALQGANAGTWQFDVHTGDFDWSPRFCEMHGVDLATDTPSLELWTGRILADDREAATSDLQLAYASEKPDYHSRYRVRANAEDTRWIEVFGFIERNLDGSPRRISGISLEATERHRTMDALTQANENLRRANESLNKFSSIAAHDLQEPLRKLEQFGDLLHQEHAEQFVDDGAFYLQVMQDSARRMRALINALLNFSRAANRELSKEPVDMNEVMQHVLVACAAAIEETGADIQIDQLPTLYGDAVLVTQLFQNLISNAVKYTKPGMRPLIHVGGDLFGPDASIHVRDEGIGIGGEHHEIIFEAFTRLNPREKVKGTGIGLAFCRTVCERHGWRLEVKSVRDGGSVFSVAAPHYRESQAA